MELLTPAKARAYVNFGRWVADCPRVGCTNALKLKPRQGSFHCGGESGCQMLAPIDWPADADDIWAALRARPIPGTRNWAPTGHRQAVATGHDTGQSVADLLTENNTHGVS